MQVDRRAQLVAVADGRRHRAAIRERREPEAAHRHEQPPAVRHQEDERRAGGEQEDGDQPRGEVELVAAIVHQRPHRVGEQRVEARPDRHRVQPVRGARPALPAAERVAEARGQQVLGIGREQLLAEGVGRDLRERLLARPGVSQLRLQGAQAAPLARDALRAQAPADGAVTPVALEQPHERELERLRDEAREQDAEHEEGGAPAVERPRVVGDLARLGRVGRRAAPDERDDEQRRGSRAGTRRRWRTGCRGRAPRRSGR